MNLLRYGFMFVNSDKGDYVSSRLPKPEDFSKALFTLDIGQNDIAAAIRKKSIEFQQVTVPNIVSQFTAQIRVSSRVNHFHLFLGSRGYWVSCVCKRVARKTWYPPLSIPRKIYCPVKVALTLRTSHYKSVCFAQFQMVF